MCVGRDEHVDFRTRVSRVGGREGGESVPWAAVVVLVVRGMEGVEWELTFAVGELVLLDPCQDRPNVATLRNVSSVGGAKAEANHQFVHQVRNVGDPELFVHGALGGKCVARETRDDDVESGRG